MRKVSLDIKTIIIFICVLLKYLIEYKINTYILYSVVLIILFFQFLRIIKSLKNKNEVAKAFFFFILSTISVIVYKDVNLLITYILALVLIGCDVKQFIKKFMIFVTFSIYDIVFNYVCNNNHIIFFRNLER